MPPIGMVLCVTDRASVQPRPHPKPTLTDFSLQAHSHTSMPF